MTRSDSRKVEVIARKIKGNQNERVLLTFGYHRLLERPTQAGPCQVLLGVVDVDGGDRRSEGWREVISTCG